MCLSRINTIILFGIGACSGENAKQPEQFFLLSPAVYINLQKNCII